MANRIVMHIDMNSYFASCEQQDNLAWRGKPIGVCEHLGGIIIAPSIEAKQWGIKTAMPVWEARKLYPKIILTPTNPDRYRKYTAKFLKVLSDYTDQIEKYSIDEAFVDLTKATNILKPNGKGGLMSVDPYSEAVLIAREIKRRITKEVGDWLKCSVGIAWNKLVAKIGSDMEKPNGLVVLRPEDKAMLYEKLKLTDIPGIAHRMQRRLNDLGIRTLLDLKNYPGSELVRQFGIMGYHLHQMGQLEGSWKENFAGTEDEPIKSMGHVYTIPQEFRKQNVLQPVLYILSEMVGRRLRASNLMGNIVSVYTHDSHSNYFGKSRKLGYFLNDGRDIFLEAISILSPLLSKYARTNFNSRMVGVTVAGLASNVHQQSLFKFYEKKKRLVAAMDKINEKYEDFTPQHFGKSQSGAGFTIARVPAFLARDIIRDSVGFGRMKEFTRAPVFNKTNAIKK